MGAWALELLSASCNQLLPLAQWDWRVTSKVCVLPLGIHRSLGLEDGLATDGGALGPRQDLEEQVARVCDT